MAEYLASIFGTEKDKVNCSFFFKIGACRHGDRCSRIHNKPTFSQTILLQNLYQNPSNITQTVDGQTTTIPGMPVMSDAAVQEHFDNFFEDVFVEMEDKYGEVEEMNVCDNLGDHLVGNVYVKFRSEEDAEKAVNDLNNRWFAARPIYAELSPVTDFREACCRQYEMGECTRSGFCNFMHLKPISRDLRRELYGRNSKIGRRTRSRSPRRDRRRSRSRDKDRKRKNTPSPSRERSKRDRRDRRSRSRDRQLRSSKSRDKDSKRDDRRDRTSKDLEKHSSKDLEKHSSRRHHDRSPPPLLKEESMDREGSENGDK